MMEVVCWGRFANLPQQTEKHRFFKRCDCAPGATRLSSERGNTQPTDTVPPVGIRSQLNNKKHRFFKRCDCAPGATRTRNQLIRSLQSLKIFRKYQKYQPFWTKK
jgi:hypothetical protein